MNVKMLKGVFKLFLISFLTVALIASCDTAAAQPGSSGEGGNSEWEKQFNPNWSYQVIDSEVDVFGGISLKFGNDNRLQAAYCGRNSNNPTATGYLCKYASYDGAKWSVELVDDMSDADVGWNGNLIFKPDGTGAISYSFNPRDTSQASVIRLAQKVEGQWTKEVLVEGYDDGTAAYDSKGGLHVVYYANSDNKSIIYAYREGGIWKREYVVSGVDIMLKPYLTLDKNDSPHIVYLDSPSSQGKYVSKNGTLWIEQDIDPSNRFSSRTYMVIDSSGAIYFLYTVNKAKELKLAILTGSIWKRELLLKAPEGDGFCDYSIAVDDFSKVHVSYLLMKVGVAFKSRGLYYGSYNWNSFTSELVDARPSVGWLPQVAADKNGKPYIVYSGFDDMSLKFAFMK